MFLVFSDDGDQTETEYSEASCFALDFLPVTAEDLVVRFPGISYTSLAIKLKLTLPQQRIDTYRRTFGAYEDQVATASYDGETLYVYVPASHATISSSEADRQQLTDLLKELADFFHDIVHGKTYGDRRPNDSSYYRDRP